MHGLDQGLLLFRIGLLDVLLAQSLFLFVARPTDEILAAQVMIVDGLTSGLTSCAPLALV
jgi:hypothetical protein